MKNIILLMVLLPLLSAAQPKDETKEAVIRAFGQLVEGYARTPQLSFSVNYRYTAIDKPGVYLDSMQGQVKISGSKYWYKMAETECVLNGDYQIMVFKEDKLIYLAKANKEIAASMAMQGMGIQALQSFDSLLRHSTDIKASIRESVGEQLIQLEFSAHPVYKSLTWHVEKKTGLIAKMVSVMRAGQLYDPSIRSQVDDKDTYASVETLYSDYQTSKIDESLFRSERYISKQGTAYQPSAQYSNYKIFLGSQGL